MVECLIRLGARVDEPGNGGCLPLHVACTEGNLTSARLLVREHKRSGVDIDSWVHAIMLSFLQYMLMSLLDILACRICNFHSNDLRFC